MHDIAGGMLRGATAGLTATVPMTLFLEAAHRCLPPREQYPLPPREITERATEAAGVDDDLSEPQKQGMTLAAHFGYGASAGVHESQSRLWEIVVARSRGFWEHYYSLLQRTFPDALGWLAEAAKHFTPSSFAREARKLHGQPAVFAVHIKARYHEQVVRELRALGLPNLEIAQAGQPYVF